MPVRDAGRRSGCVCETAPGASADVRRRKPSGVAVANPPQTGCSRPLSTSTEGKASRRPGELRSDLLGEKSGLLTVRKVMSVGVGSPYTLWDENQRLPRRAGASASARCPTIPRWLLGRRDRRVPRHLAPDGLALARLVPGPRPGGTDGSPRTGPAPQAHRHPGEDRPAVVARQPRGARVLHRVVDRPPAGPADRGGVRHPVQPPLPQRVAEGPRLHPPEARTRPPRARPGGDRRLARFGLAAHQEEGEASGGSPRLDRPERPADGPAGPPHLGA